MRSESPRLRGLIRLLREYAADDARRFEDRRRMFELAAGEHDPFDRSTFDPGHFTASAFILSSDERSLLLIFHRKLQRWLQPGGHIDPGDESVVEAARREAGEEAGVHGLQLLESGIFDIDVHPIPARPKEPGHEHFDVRFLFRAESELMIAGSDAEEARWVSLVDFAAHDHAADESVIRVVRKLQQR